MRWVLLVVLLVAMSPAYALWPSYEEQCCLGYKDGYLLEKCDGFDTDTCPVVLAQLEEDRNAVLIHRDNTVFLGWTIAYLIIAGLVFYIVNHLISQHGLIERR